MFQISPLHEDDRQGWQPLAVGYNTFYERVLPDADYDRTWRRLMKAEELQGLAARLDGGVVGIATTCSTPASGATRPVISPTCSSTRRCVGRARRGS